MNRRLVRAARTRACEEIRMYFCGAVPPLYRVRQDLCLNLEHAI